MGIDFKHPGRIISSAKRGPNGHVCVFNANVCTRSRGKIWWGDLDLTADSAELKKLAQEQREPVYVLRENDARFHNESSPQWEKAVAIYSPDAPAISMTYSDPL